MKKLLFTFVLFLAILSFSSCSNPQTKNPTFAKAYYFSSDTPNKTVSLSVNLSRETEEDVVSELFSLLSSPTKKRHVPMFDRKISLQDVAVSDGLCSLTLSPAYNHLSDTERVAANACIVKSLSSLPFVEKVAITCENSYELFSDDDFILSSPVASYEKLSVNLYYVDSSRTSLICHTRDIPILPDRTLEEDVITLLFTPPDKTTMISGFPQGTKLNNVYVSENCCYVDVSPEFFLNASHDKEHEKSSLFSIVNTLTELPMISSVKFLIDGEDGYGYTYYNIAFPLNNSQAFAKNK
ncbi:MAG: GerMN domain-containing protein [Oscillospiraceae bacterium]|nr:GerMN domain-containing protein [Oscillospiraceae bacterium]